MMVDADRTGPKIVVVGPCASGKSTLVSRLRSLGFDAYAVAQEHSAVRDLWQRKQPDVLIALEVSLDVVRDRRSPTWLEAVYQRQHERLASAYAAADLTLDTAGHDAEEVVTIICAWLHRWSAEDSHQTAKPSILR